MHTPLQDWRFLSARSACALSRFPRFQDLPPDATQPCEAFDHLVFVSHRWETAEEPDATGRQLAALQRLFDELASLLPRVSSTEPLGIDQHGPVVAAHMLFRLLGGGAGKDAAMEGDLLEHIGVWYDFSCLPQASRSVAEEDLFARSMLALPQGLGAREVTTLILRHEADDYEGRAWCFTEAVLASRKNDSNLPLQFWPERWAEPMPEVFASDLFFDLVGKSSLGVMTGKGALGWSHQLTAERCLPTLAAFLAEIVTLPMGQALDVAASAARLLPRLGLQCREERDSIMIPLLLAASLVSEDGKGALAILREAAVRFVGRLPLRLQRQADGYHWEAPPEPPPEAQWPIFISYRRSPLTGEIAKWLKDELDGTPIQSLNDQSFRLKVFVDALEPVHGDFQLHLVPHLQHSRMLILLADHGAATRHVRPKRDFLYEELDWWAQHRPKTAPVILDTDRVSAAKLVANSPEFISWNRQSWLECHWEEWRSGPEGTLAREKERLLRVLRESIRIYGHKIHLAEVRRLRHLLHRLVFTIIAVVMAAIVAGWLAFELKESLTQSEARNYALAVTGSRSSIELGDFPAARSALATAPAALRGWEWGHLQAKADGALLKIAAHQADGGAKAVAFGPDGKSLLSVGADGFLRLWDLETGRALRAECPIPDRDPPPGDAATQAAVIASGVWPAGPPALGTLAVSSDGTRIAVGNSQGQVVVWDAGSWAVTHLFKAHPQHVLSLAFIGPDGLLSMGQEGKVKRWDLSASPPGEETLADVDTQGLAVVSADLTRIAVYYGGAGDAGAPGQLNLFSLNPAEGLTSLRRGGVGNDMVADMTYLGAQHIVVLADFQGRLLFIGENNESPVVVLAVPKGSVGFLPLGAVAASLDGKRVASGDKSGLIKLWDAETKQMQRVLAGHDGDIKSLVFSGSGDLLASASDDGSVRVWEVGRHSGPVQSVPLDFDVWSLAVHPKTGALAVAGSSGQMRLLSPDGDTLHEIDDDADDNQEKLCYSPDGARLLSLGNYGSWMIRDGADLQPRMTPDPDTRVKQGFYSGDGRVVLLLEDGSVQVRNPDGGDPQQLIPAEENSVTAMAPVGEEQMVIGRKNGTLALLDLSGKIVATFSGGLEEPTLLAAAADGRIAAASGTRVAWWSRNWACQWRLDRRLDKAHQEPIRALAFTPDGRRLVTGSEDQTCRVWDLQTGISLLRTDPAKGIIHSLAFGPDRRALFIGSCEEQVTILEAAGE